jgi:hypothetical protein
VRHRRGALQAELTGGGCAVTICPNCGKPEKVHRSHTRGLMEKIFKTATPYKVFRCHGCNWRGWLIPGTNASGAALRSYKIVAVVFMTGLMFGVLFALYFSWREAGPGKLLP